MSLAQDTFVVFVDMLGFASLVESEGDELEDLSPIFKNIERHGSVHGVANLLQYRFINFHRCIETARLSLQDARSGTIIVFSDSAFFQSDTLPELIELCTTLMRNLIESGVPARIGLARGSFKFLRSMTDASRDVSVHMSQFVGTGVVRAYLAAERSRVPGLRVLLHHSLSNFLDSAMPTLPVSQPADADTPVEYELNYLDPKADQMFGADYADVIIFDELRWMWGEAEERFHYHYQATFDSLNAMRAQYGREPYPFAKMLDRTKYDEEHGITPPDDRAEGNG